MFNSGAATRIPRRYAFWIVGLALFSMTASAAAPSPLYPVYQASWGFSAVMLTTVFAVYAVALLAALLTVGALSDHLGRRPVLIVALLLLAASMVVFIVSDNVGWLVAARVLQGIAVGVATGALSAAVIDLQPNAQMGPLVNSVTPAIGLAGGALGAGLLVQCAPAPTVLVYALLIGASLVLAVALFFIPESAPVRGFDSSGHLLRSLRPQVAVPAHIRGRFLRVVPCLLATWSLGGLHLSLGPSIISTVLGIDNHLIAGLEIFALFASGSLAAALLRGVASRTVMVGGTLVLAVGVVVMLLSLATTSALVYFLGTMVSGFGWGATFLGAMQTIGGLAEPHERGRIFATTFVVSYLAFSVPAVIAGISVRGAGLLATTVVYGSTVILVALVAAVGLTVQRRRAGKRRVDEPAPVRVPA